MLEPVDSQQIFDSPTCFLFFISLFHLYGAAFRDYYRMIPSRTLRRNAVADLATATRSFLLSLYFLFLFLTND